MKLGQFITLCLSLAAFFAPQKSEGQTISGTVNEYFKVTHFIPSYNAVRVQSITGLTSGDRVLIIQMKGATITTSNNSTFGNLSNTPSLGGAGLYEFATICGLLNDTVVFERQLLNTYDFNESVQMVYVPVFTDVTVNGTLTADPWNPSTGLGGVIAIEATGAITLNADIDASGAGYRGGTLFEFSTTPANYSCSNSLPADAYFYGVPPVTVGNFDIRRFEHGAYKGEGIAVVASANSTGMGKHANGGGGGNNHNTGGGGGGNYGAGGNGGFQNVLSCSGNYFGIGGLSLNSYAYSLTNNRIFFGGGGGSGHANNPEGTPGGNGGGIIFIKCTELIGNNRTISANGTQGINSTLAPNPTNESRGDGGGGGGGGGTVLLNVSTYTTTLNVSANGADGNDAGFQAQCPGPGGGGGGGVIWSSSALPVNVNSNVAGGANGIIKNAPLHDPACEGLPNGATAGTNGTVLTDFTILEGSIFNCSGVLSTESLKEWYGKRMNQSVELRWKLDQTEQLQAVHLEKRTATGEFKLVKAYQQPAAGNYSLIDNNPEFPVRYRLLLISANGRKSYSQQLSFTGNDVKRLRVFPNPVLDEVRVQLPSVIDQKVSIKVFDYTGKQLMQTEQIVKHSAIIILPVKELTAGTYLVQIQFNNELYVAKVVKQ